MSRTGSRQLTAIGTKAKPEDPLWIRNRQRGELPTRRRVNKADRLRRGTPRSDGQDLHVRAECQRERQFPHAHSFDFSPRFPRTGLPETVADYQPLAIGTKSYRVRCVRLPKILHMLLVAYFEYSDGS